MNEFGEDVLWDIAASMVELRRRKLNAAKRVTNPYTIAVPEKQAESSVTA